MDWLKNMTMKDLPNGDMEMIAKLCGLKAAVALMKACAGDRITIPRSWAKRLRDRMIIEGFDGANANRLSTRFGVTRRYIYKIIERERRSCRKAERRASRGANGRGELPSIM